MMPIPDHNSLVDHISITAVVLVIHAFLLWYALRPSRKKSIRSKVDRTRMTWFLTLHCLILTTALNLTLLSENEAAVGAGAGLVLLLVVPLLWWYARGAGRVKKSEDGSTA